MTAIEIRRQPRRPWRRFGYSMLLAVGIALGVLVLFEDRLIFFPTRYPIGRWNAAAIDSSGRFDIEDCWMTTEDGIRLHAWWCKNQIAAGDTTKPTPRQVLLWFHGNAGNLSDRAEIMFALASIPVDVVIPDYRGYGRSEGNPSEAGLERDAIAVWHFVTGERGIPGRSVVILGESLGGAVAIDLATRVDPGGLIVQSSFTSVPDLAARYYPFVPRLLIRTRFDSLSRIPTVTCPKLFVHSRADEIIPYEHGRRLFEAAAPPKSWYEVAGAGHNEMFWVGGRAYLEEIRRFLDQVAASVRDSVTAPSLR